MFLRAITAQVMSPWVYRQAIAGPTEERFHGLADMVESCAPLCLLLVLDSLSCLLLPSSLIQVTPAPYRQGNKSALCVLHAAAAY